jgi:hypothetical protein
MTVTLTIADAKRVAHEVVAEFGEDYLYPRQPTGDMLENDMGEEVPETACLYVHADDKGRPIPGCLVAHVLHRLGVPLDEMGARENTAAMNLVHALQRAQVVLMADNHVDHYLNDIQSQQDEGGTWGQAIAYGDDRY